MLDRNSVPLSHFCFRVLNWSVEEVGKGPLPQPPQMRKLRCALISYFEALQKLGCGLKRLKFGAL